MYSNQQDPSQYNSWSKYHASRAQVPSRTEGALCLRSKVCSLRQFCYLSPRAPATRCQEHLNHNNGRGSLPLILCLCQYRTSPNHEGPILTSEGKGPCACAAKYDPFRKFIQNTGKRNGTSTARCAPSIMTAFPTTRSPCRIGILGPAHTVLIKGRCQIWSLFLLSHFLSAIIAA